MPAFPIRYAVPFNSFFQYVIIRVRSLSGCDIYQADLTILQNWSEELLLKVVRLGPSLLATNYTMSQDNGIQISLMESQCERRLGILIDNKLRFDCHIECDIPVQVYRSLTS